MCTVSGNRAGKHSVVQGRFLKQQLENEGCVAEKPDIKIIDLVQSKALVFTFRVSLVSFSVIVQWLWDTQSTVPLLP